MTDLTITDDWLLNNCRIARDAIRADVMLHRENVARWQPRVCPPHPVVCPAGGIHVWEHDSDDRGSWCGCVECGAPCDGPFYPKEGE